MYQSKDMQTDSFILVCYKYSNCGYQRIDRHLQYCSGYEKAGEKVRITGCTDQ